MTAAAGETALPWRALRSFGVEIQHDLSAPLSKAQEQQFVALLWPHNLVLACNQTLSMERQRELCRLAGQILYRPENILKHSWRNGDFVIWDNIALQHMRGSLAHCGKRVLQRVIVGKEGSAAHIGGNAQLHRSV
jgi:alpha-ketoglutarate-dependent taurine dioxygenase